MCECVVVGTQGVGRGRSPAPWALSPPAFPQPPQPAEHRRRQRRFRQNVLHRQRVDCEEDLVRLQGVAVAQEEGHCTAYAIFTIQERVQMFVITKVHDYCYERGFTIYPGKISTTNTFRLCSLGAIDEEDIKDFFVVFKEALVSTGVQIPVNYND